MNDHRPDAHPAGNDRPTDHRATDHGSTGHQSTDHQSTDHRSTDHRATDHGSTGHQSTDHQSTDHRSTSDRALDDRPTGDRTHGQERSGSAPDHDEPVTSVSRPPNGAMQVTAGEALAAAARLLHAAGMPVDAAERTAWALVTAELWHLGSHGLMRLPHYLRRFERGGTDPRATLRVVRDTPVTATYDGGNGLGHWQVWHAAQVAVEKAMAAGIAIVSVGNSGHCGSLGLYVLPMVDRGLIGMIFSNGPAVMPPWGGHAPVLSTSPLAAGIPTPGHPAIVDLATTAVARGTIAQYRAAGRPLEPGWAFDAEGHETIDPVAALAGMLAPLGGAKGYALALVVEALTGAVVGPHLAGDVADPLSPDDADRPQRIAHTVLAIDPACLDVDGNGPLRLAELARRIDDAGGRLPGSHRSATASSARDEVITIAGRTASALAEAAARVGLRWPVGAT